MTVIAHRIKRHWGGALRPISEPVKPPPPALPRRAWSPRYVVRRALEERQIPVCECGANATHVAIFWQLTADGHYVRGDALLVCCNCAEDFINPERIITLEDAYELANLPVPQVAQS